MAALPPSMARTSPSGQTWVQLWQPMQKFTSICGCCARGPSDISLPFAADFSAFSSRTRRLLRYPRRKNAQMEAAMAIVMSVSIGLEISHHHDHHDVDQRQHRKGV